eukprot:TRINITY_DN3_c0_g1_i3.p2 TRINITY_DN3_c0_g1~~TRINITY_DN3_c0_g1_i3.p2  ORF type:complete len:116 (-),score=23.19 TRINITY_DN3_c0_g1_i3:1483-1830(-)
MHLARQARSRRMVKRRLASSIASAFPISLKAVVKRLAAMMQFWSQFWKSAAADVRSGKLAAENGAGLGTGDRGASRARASCTGGDEGGAAEQHRDEGGTTEQIPPNPLPPPDGEA